MIEKRANPRVRTLKGGSIIFGPRPQLIALCAIYLKRVLAWRSQVRSEFPTISHSKSSRNRRSVIAVSPGAPPIESAFHSS